MATLNTPTNNAAQEGSGVGDNPQGQRKLHILTLAPELRNHIYEFCVANHLPELDNFEYQATVRNAPPGAISVYDARPCHAAHSSMIPAMYSPHAMSEKDRMRFIVALTTRYPRFQGPEYIKERSACPPFLLTCKQIYHEAGGMFVAKVALDFISFPGIEQCWVRSIGRFRPLLIRHVYITLWDFEQLAESPTRRRDNLRKLVDVVSDIQGVLRLAPNIERVTLDVRLGPMSDGVRISCARGISSCIDLHVDAPGLLKEFLLLQPLLKRLDVQGCELSRVFVQKDIQELVDRGVKVLGQREDKQEVVDASDPYDVFVLSDDEMDWADWESEFGEDDEITHSDDDEEDTLGKDDHTS